MLIHKGAVRIEGYCCFGLGHRRLPYLLLDIIICAKNGMRHRILVVEPYGDALSRAVPWTSRNGRVEKCQVSHWEGEGVSVMARSEIMIECNSLAKKCKRGFVLLRVIFVKVPETALIRFPRVEPFRRFAQHALLLGLG